jgi:hypothetical protein
MSRALAATVALVAIAATATPAEAGKKPGYRNHVYVRPAMGVNSFTPEDGDTVSIMSVGGVAGINYWETGRQLPRIRGNARVSGDYVVGASDLSGYQVRVGNFTGPLWETVGFTIGPDFFYSQYQYGDTELPAAGGVGIPFTVDAYLDAFSVFGGIEPAWYLMGDRPGRDWSTAEGAPGFGHEFAYFAGVGMKVGGLNIGGSVRHTMTAYGEQNSFGLSASFDGEIGGKKGKGKKGKKGR